MKHRTARSHKARRSHVRTAFSRLSSGSARRTGAGPPMQLSEYLPILIFLVVATVIGCVLLTLGSLLGPKRPDSEKLSPYECGFEAFEDARSKFDVRYYLMAILFIVFDLEIAFMFPWAVVFKGLGVFGLIEMAVFIVLLLVGFVYVWKKGALEWE